MKHKPADAKAAACEICRRPAHEECGRLHCGNRRPVTVNTAGGNYAPHGAHGALRRYPTSKE